MWVIIFPVIGVGTRRNKASCRVPQDEGIQLIKILSLSVIMWKFFLAHTVRAQGSDGHQNVLSQIGYSHMLENSESKKLGVFKTTPTQKQQNNPTKTKPTQPQKCVLPLLSLLHHLPRMASIAWRRSLLSLPCVWTLLVPVAFCMFSYTLDV